MYFNLFYVFVYIIVIEKKKKLACLKGQKLMLPNFSEKLSFRRKTIYFIDVSFITLKMVHNMKI